jgi:hypothetical protein
MTLRNFLVIWRPELASVVTDIKVIDAFECPNVTNARMCMDAANAAGKYATHDEGHLQLVESLKTFRRCIATLPGSPLVDARRDSKQPAP